MQTFPPTDAFEPYSRCRGHKDGVSSEVGCRNSGLSVVMEAEERRNDSFEAGNRFPLSENFLSFLVFPSLYQALSFPPSRSVPLCDASLRTSLHNYNNTSFCPFSHYYVPAGPSPPPPCPSVPPSIQSLYLTLISFTAKASIHLQWRTERGRGWGGEHYWWYYYKLFSELIHELVFSGSSILKK